MKKKTLIFSGMGVSLLIIGICLFLFLPKPVKIGYEEIPVDTNSKPKMRMTRFTNYIETTEDLKNALEKIYEAPSQEEIEAMLSSDPLKKYDEVFFKDNFIYISTSGSGYSGQIHSGPLFKIEKSFLFKARKLKIECSIISELGIQYQHEKMPLYYSDYTPYEPRGYILEIPRKQFEKYNLAYDDIEIAYLNANDDLFNVQVGKDKGKYDPKYPMPEYAYSDMLSEEPRLFGLKEPE